MAKPNWIPCTVTLGDLNPWAQNPRLSTKAQAQRLIKSFNKFGQVESIAIGPDNEVYDGHQRLFALLTIHGPTYSIDARRSDRALTDDERRGRYNEDTDLSLRALKDGWCTFLLQSFCCKKIATMKVKGGNTESLYKLDGIDGRLLMAQSLQKQHPDVVKITRKWGRWQHNVDYRPFKNNRLKKKEGVVIPKGTNNYGMKLIKVSD